MAVEDRLVEGFLRQAGIIRLNKYSQLFMAAKAISHMQLPRGRRVSFLAPSGAMLVVLSDFCLSLGLQVPQFTEPTRKFLQDISPPIVRMRNPVDIWFAAGNHGVDYAYGEGMRAILQDPNIDAVVPILLLTDDTGVPPLDFIVELAEEFPEKPIYVTFSGERKHMDAAKAFLEPQGVPTFQYIEEPFETLALLAQAQEVLER
jgi:acetyltransferase